LAVSLTIWIDSDACPRAVKDIVYRAAQKRHLAVRVVANKAQHVPPSEHIRMIQVSGGPDVADDYIAEHAVANDLAITQDIPLAARLVPMGVVTLSTRGEEFTDDNIRERLSVRDFMTNLRDSGIQTGGPSAFGVKQKQKFANAFDRALSRLASRG